MSPPRITARDTVVAVCALLLSLSTPLVAAEATTPPETSTDGAPKGATLHVSKQGDNSDGCTWAKAFRTIQAALDAIPDANGGHRVVIRPDTYFEANLHPAHKGAPGAYNVLQADFDGSLGSGATGLVVIDSSCPGVAVRTNSAAGIPQPGWVVVDSREPETGFKCVDWWGALKCDPSFSGVAWDRWTFRRLYCTGSEGFGWDMTNQDGVEFSVIVEDCVAIGRFCGGCVMGHVGRPAEPVMFRRSCLVCLDWWGDAGAAYVRACHKSIPDAPDAVFENCTLIAPDNALECGYPGYPGYTRVKFKQCSMVVWNFSQPQGTPSGGIIHTPLDGKQLHVDLEDCSLMGYRVFGAGSGQIGYSVKGKAQAYLQYQQPIPEGFEQLNRWPVEMFASLRPSRPTTAQKPSSAAEPVGPSASSGPKGATLYVSKLGDNSDGSSWRKALHSIQAALLAVPDDKGGHRIVIRPDTYTEADLYPKHKGAPGAYNVLTVDFDGQLGSGATGYAVLDASDPGGGMATFRNNFRQTAEVAGEAWDRWIVRHVYASGADSGLFWDLRWDLRPREEPFSIIVEDSVGIGRAFGGGAAYVLCRADEPIVFRRCTLCTVDRWGDAGGAYVRAEHDKLSDQPDVIFEDCLLVGPDNALQAGNPGLEGYSRVKIKNSHLVSLNFSQPRGTPSSGVINSKIDGKLLHVDFEDSTLMGFKVFGAGKGEVGYSIRGDVRAYVQFEQPVPEGFVRLGRWPVETFAPLLPAKPGAVLQPPSAVARKLTKLPVSLGTNVMESTPLLYKGRPLLFHSRRVGGSNVDLDQTCLLIADPQTGQEVTQFGGRHSLGCALVVGDEINVFAAEHTENDWFHDIYRFSSTDLKNWKRELAIRRAGNEHLLNSSVCRDEQGYLMAYESDVPVGFCFKFARSKDLANWQKIDGLVFKGSGNEYSACPVIRYFKPYYYVIYLHAAIPGHNGWVSFLARSKDLATWQLSPKNPILEATEGEGCNNSDVDLIETDGKTYVYYSTGDQQTWGELRRAVYPGPMAEFFESYFPGDADQMRAAYTPMTEVSARVEPPADK